MITTDKVTEMFCILDEFCKNLDSELTKNLHIAPIDEGYTRMRNRKEQISKSEIMTILLCYHFGSFRNFKLHLLCYEMGDVLTFCLTPANVDDRDPRVWQVFTKVLYGKVFADKGYIKQEFFENLFNQGIHLVYGLKSNMKNKLIPLWDKMMLRKRYIIECINELLKNKANLVYSRHRSVHNFLMNLCAALAAYCFFENKPEALPVRIEKSRQLELF